MFISRALLLLALLPALHAQTAPCRPETLLQQATEALNQHHSQAAAALLDSLRPCPNLSPLQRFQQAWLYGRARRFQTALDLLSQVPANIPDRSTHTYAVALSQFELSDYASARQTLEAQRSTASLDTKSINLLAVTYSKLQNEQQAYLLLTAEASQHPDLTTYLNLITVCAEGGNFENAAAEASKATALFPQSAAVWIALGAAESLLGRLNPAEAAFQTAVRLDPQRPDARFFLALASYNQQNFAQAATTLEQAQRDHIHDADLCYLLAECLLKLHPQNVAAPLEQLDAALALNPESIPARTLRGRLRLEQKNLPAALSDLEFAHRQDPTSRAATYSLARVYRSLGRTGDAANLFNQLRDAKPDSVTEFGSQKLHQSLVTP